MFAGYYVDPALKSNVYASLLNLKSDRGFATPHYHCPSGNCTWEPVHVLAAEYSCTDLTSFLTLNCNKSQIAKPITEIPYDCEVSLPQRPRAGFLNSSGMGTVFALESRFSNLYPAPYGDRYPLSKIRYNEWAQGACTCILKASVLI